MLERRITQKLSDWKNRPGHHPLILRRIRQTGKTTSVRDSGEHNYENTVFLDLRKNRTDHAAFDGNSEVSDMVMAITASDLPARWICLSVTIMRQADHLNLTLFTASDLMLWDHAERYVICTSHGDRMDRFADRTLMIKDAKIVEISEWSVLPSLQLVESQIIPVFRDGMADELWIRGSLRKWAPCKCLNEKCGFQNKRCKPLFKLPVCEAVCGNCRTNNFASGFE